MAQATHPSHPGPKELDLDLNRMRADVFTALRACMQQLNDIDAVERVLNRQTAQIAGQASATASRNGNGGALSAAARRILLGTGAQAPFHEEEEPEPEHSPKRSRRSPRRKYRPRNPNAGSMVKEQILMVLARRSPQQSGSMMQAVADRFPGPLAAQSTFARVLRELQKEGRITIDASRRWPLYAIAGEAGAGAEKAAGKVARKKTNAHRARSGTGQSFTMSVLRAVVAAGPKGADIPTFTATLEADPEVKWLDDYTHNTQVSWALKSHREKGRIKTIERGDGTRIHRALRPAITVTKG